MDALYEKAKMPAPPGEPWKPGERADAQLAFAEEHCANPEILSEAFLKSVDQFASFPTPQRVAFRPSAPSTLESYLENSFASSTSAVAARIIKSGFASPDVHYVSRELSPANCVGAALASGKSTRAAPKMDLLLRRERVPVVCELKAGGDQNAHYGLLQAMALAVQLTPAAQRARLAEAFPSHQLATEGPLDVWVIFAEHKSKGKQKAKMAEIARDLTTPLLKSEVRSYIGDISFLDASPDDENRVVLKPSKLGT